MLIVKYSINDNWAIAARGEYYCDENGILISTGTPNGFKTTSVSLNVDYALASNLSFRIEGRTLNSKDKVFMKGNTLKKNDTFLTTSVTTSF